MPRRLVLHLLQVRRLVVLVIPHGGDLDGVEFLGGGVVDQLGDFPVECPYGVGIEAEPDGNRVRRSGLRVRDGGHSARNRLQKRATTHDCYCNPAPLAPAVHYPSMLSVNACV